MHILHTVLYMIPKLLTRRIYITIKNFFSEWSFSLFSWPECVSLGWYCREKLDANHSKVKRVKRQANNIYTKKKSTKIYTSTNLTLVPVLSVASSFWLSHLGVYSPENWNSVYLILNILSAIKLPDAYGS